MNEMQRGPEGVARTRTVRQTSAGGVTYRRRDGALEVALIAVGDPARWQLPKGAIEPGEQDREAAVREVREETGLRATPLAPLDTIEYWYQGQDAGQRVRYHKFVKYFLMRCTGGDVSEHDDEVREARWMRAEEAIACIAFPNERRILAQALECLAALERLERKRG
jgi:8-oxo-dGTP pyrophosphatase MutT (NUDIX family)